MKTHGKSSPSDIARFGDIQGLRRLAARLVRDPAEADDVVQESLLLGLRRAGGRVRDIGAWLRGVVRNKARESRRAAMRRESRESEAHAGATPMEPIDIAARLEVHDQLVAAVKALAEPYRSAVWLHYVEGREAVDLARELGTPVETVRTRIKRGIVRLREDLDRRHGGKRVDWIPSLAAFGGVEPAISLVATTTATASSLGIVKHVGAAALVLVVVGSAFVGLPLLFPKPDPPLVVPMQPAAERGAVAAQHQQTRDDAAEAARADEVASLRRDVPKIIATKPFTDQPEAGLALAARAIEGTFSFHFQQSFSFVSRSVSDDAASADLVFKSSAGGTSGVTFEAPDGAIVNLLRFRGKLRTLKHAPALARSVVRADAGAVGSDTTADGNDHTPTSEAFIMRTRNGHYVLFAITARAGRAEFPDWTKMPVTIHYVANQSEPVFRQGTGDLNVDGIEIDSQLVPQLDAELHEAHEVRIAPFRQRLAELDRRAAAIEPAIQARDGADVRVSAVLDRGLAAPMGGDEAYVAATYSFEKATRDDVKATRNDWDFQLNDWLGVTMLGDDRSRIWDLGQIPLTDVRAGNVPALPGSERAGVEQGHVYAIHTADSDTDQWAVMRVEEVVPAESMIFSWFVIQEPSRLCRTLESTDPGVLEQAPADPLPR